MATGLVDLSTHWVLSAPGLNDAAAPGSALRRPTRLAPELVGRAVDLSRTPRARERSGLVGGVVLTTGVWRRAVVGQRRGEGSQHE